ncbi:MAG: helix-turn-helix domain-containing protein [Actinomycetota bacterium]
MADRLGDFIRSQRRLANLSLRELAKLTRVSNPYLSQIERGIYRPSAQVLKSIAEALDISAESLFTQAGFLKGGSAQPTDTEHAIRVDDRLHPEQKETLLRVYRSFVGQGSESRTGKRPARERKTAAR